MAKLHSSAVVLPKTRTSLQAGSRRGAIAVYAAIMMVVILAAAAFALDVGMICMAKAELQRTADAAALAATSELLYRLKEQPTDPVAVVQTNSTGIRLVADSASKDNKVFQESPGLQLNALNDEAGEIVIGEMTRDAGGVSLIVGDPTRYNSVSVRVRRTAERNGELPLFFGRVLGLNHFTAEAQAQAAFIKEFKGFRVPSGGGDPPPTLLMFPFAIERSAWEAAVNGQGSDDYSWNADNERVEQRQSDGIKEINLYPLDTGAAGNFGTIDVGSDKSTNETLARQIVEGMSRQDLEYHGGQLALDSSGKLLLSGDPGMKVGPILPAVSQIIGQTRIVPLYSSTSGQGQYSTFTITAFGACRVLDVDLNGGNKHLTVQPATMITRGGIAGDGAGGSSHIFSPIVLVR